MRYACIDIGSNTTRLLVAERDSAAPGGLRELATERVFTAIGAGAGPDGSLPPPLIAEVVDVVTAQAASARRQGAGSIRIVATAAIRRAPNRGALVAGLALAGVELDVLTGEQEARLAFAGAIATRAPPPSGPVAVIDVGGGSTELAVGLAEADPAWSVSLPVGSSSLTQACVRRDPPSPACLDRLSEAARIAFAAVSPPPANLLLAVGGSATSLAFLGGDGAQVGAADAVDAGSLGRVLIAVAADPVATTAVRLGLAADRVRLLPAGISLLARASLVLGQPLRIARGGLREGVILELLG